MAVGVVICCGRWAAGLAGCGVGRCWRWAAGCCEVWQAVGAVQVGQGWRWCVVIVCGGLLLAWSSGAALAGLSFPVQAAGGAICCGCGALAWSSGQRRQHPARAGLLIRQAGQVAGGKAAQKKKARAAARGALLLWPSVCAGGAICCAGCVPVHIVGGGGLFPCSGAGPLLALALIRAQRFPLSAFQRHGWRWRCSIRCVFAVCRRGQILHFTG